MGTTVSVAVESRTEDFTYGAERFQEEARTLAKFMGQPNIAGVTDYFDENDTSYFVMDYIEGISFKTYIANHGGKVSVEEALNMMIPVLRALTAVHAEGFIHRDVTPDNIYITKDGMVKLLGLRLRPVLHRGQIQKSGCHPESGLRAERAVHPPEPPGALHRRLLLRGVLLRRHHRLSAAGVSGAAGP